MNFKIAKSKKLSKTICQLCGSTQMKPRGRSQILVQAK